MLSKSTGGSGLTKRTICTLRAKFRGRIALLDLVRRLKDATSFILAETMMLYMAAARCPVTAHSCARTLVWVLF